MRAIPVPYHVDISMQYTLETTNELTVFGPAPIKIARPEGGIVL
jgi:hypothetical protein